MKTGQRDAGAGEAGEGGAEERRGEERRIFLLPSLRSGEKI